MNNHQCPLCGKETVEDEVFCRECQEIAQNSYPADFFTNNKEISFTQGLTSTATENNISQTDSILEEQEDNTVIADAIIIPASATTKIKSNKKIYLFFGIGLLVLVAVGAIGSYLFIQNKEARETEENYWNTCIIENTPTSYSKYLVQYPEGIFSIEAQKRIVDLRKKEEAEWKEVKKTTDINKYLAFLTDHPNTPYAGAIKNAMDSLSWAEASSVNTADAYKAYIDNINLGYFTGNYQPLAQERYDYLSQLKTLDGDELKAVRKLIDDMFKSLSSRKYKDIKSAMAPVLNNFYGSKNVPSEALTSMLETKIKQQQIKDIIYTPDTDSSEIILDNRGIYFTDLPVARQIIYKDRKKKKENTVHNIHLELDKNKKVIALYENSKE